MARQEHPLPATSIDVLGRHVARILLLLGALSAGDAFASARSFGPTGEGSRISARLAETSTASGWTYDLHAQVAALKFDGSFDVLHVGPTACVGYALGPVTPELCVSASLSRAGGELVGVVGPQIMVELFVLQPLLGLPTAPAIGVGWDLIRLGEGGGFDATGASFYFALSASVLGL